MPRPRPRTLDDALASPRLLRRIAAQWDRRLARGNTTAILLGACDPEGYLAIIDVGQGPMILLADARRSDASLDVDSFSLRFGGWPIVAWKGLYPTILRYFAGEVEAGAVRVCLDAVAHLEYRIGGVAS